MHRRCDGLWRRLPGMPGAFSCRDVCKGPPADTSVSSRRCHAVVGLEDETLRPVLADVSLLDLSDDKKRVEDVFSLCAG